MTDKDKNQTCSAPNADTNKYKGTPVPSPMVRNGKHLPAFLIDGDVMPKLGDQIVIKYGNQTFTGRVSAILKGNIVAITTNTRN